MRKIPPKISSKAIGLIYRFQLVSNFLSPYRQITIFTGRGKWSSVKKVVIK